MAAKRDGLFKRGPIWWIRTDPVTGKAHSTRCRDIEAARAFRAERERLKTNPSYAASKTARLDKWIARVIASKEKQKKSPATIGVYRTKLGHWLRIAPNALLCEVLPPFVDAFVEKRRAEEVTDHTIRKEVDHLCIVMRAAERAGEYVGNVDALCPPDLHTGYEPRERALTREELFPLLEELKPELMAVVAVAVALGCRLSEIYRLTPADINWAAGIVLIRGTKTKKSLRRVPILSLFRELLEAAALYLPLGEEPNNLHRDIKAACARAGIANATPNDFRRTHATLLSEEGVDADVTRRLLGHTTRALVDRIYARPRPEALGKLAETKLLSAAPLRQRDNVSEAVFEPADDSAEKPGADFETRTRDLRFTKPLSDTDETVNQRDIAEFSPVNWGQLVRLGAVDVTLMRQRFDRAAASIPGLRKGPTTGARKTSKVGS
jgi:integrase